MVRKQRLVAFKPPIRPGPGLNTPVKQEKEFFQTWLEFAAQKFQQIVRSSQTVNSTVTLYTVPTNMILFITEAFVSVTSTNAANSSASIYFDAVANTIIGVSARLNQNDSSALNFRNPIKVPSGTSVFLVSSGNATGAVNAGFNGFLVPF